MSALYRTNADRIFDIVNFILITIIVLIVFYPLYYIIIASITSPDLINSGDVWLYPRDITFIGYERIMEDSRIWQGYANSLFYTIFGTALNVSITIMAGYALSRKDFYIRNYVMIFLIITMYVRGGLIPRFILVKSLGLLDTRAVMIILGAATVYNVIVTRSFFQATIPDELKDAAFVDGCTNFKFFFKIVLPLSRAIVAVMVVFYGVAHWNQYFRAMIFLNSYDLYPLQIILRDILIKNQVTQSMLDLTSELTKSQEDLAAASIIKYGLIIVSSVPMLILYPLAQKYFVKGVMIGSIKG